MYLTKPTGPIYMGVEMVSLVSLGLWHKQHMMH